MPKNLNKLIQVPVIFVVVSLACRTLLPDETGTIPSSSSQADPASTRMAPRPITCQDDACLDSCIERIHDVVKTREFDPIGGDYADTEAKLNLVIYKVENGTLGEPTLLYVPEEFQPFQKDIEAQRLVWIYASALLPPQQLKWIKEYTIFTDGLENGLAWVDARDQERTEWELGIDIADAQDPILLTYTLVHEYGHLITLNTDQIPPSDYYYGWTQNPATCEQFLSPEGCTNPDSYLNLFYQAFWVNLLEDWRENVEKIQVDSDEEFFGLVHDFYGSHEDEFVGEYASSNIYEDMAESFMHFVLEPKPNGAAVYQRKILFFYDFPELVAVRKQMIENICSYTPR